MLVLSRKEEELIKARATVSQLRELLQAAEREGKSTVDLVTVKVVKINGNVVRLGCEAPTEIDLRRGELAETADPAATKTRP